MSNVSNMRFTIKADRYEKDRNISPCMKNYDYSDTRDLEAFISPSDYEKLFKLHSDEQERKLCINNIWFNILPQEDVASGTMEMTEKTRLQIWVDLDSEYGF